MKWAGKQIKKPVPSWAVAAGLLLGYGVLQWMVAHLALPKSLITLYPWILILFVPNHGRRWVYPVLGLLTLFSVLGMLSERGPGFDLENALVLAVATFVLIVLCSEVILRTLRRLRSLNHDLKIALSKAQDAAIAKGRFLAVMSHEIRTPLGGIVGMTRMMVEQETRPNQIKSLKLIEGSAEELMSMINSILDFSRLESGKMVLHSEMFELRRMLEQLVANFQVLAAQRELSLELQLDPLLPARIYLDKHRLRQVLANLLANAIKFTPIGRVELQVNSLAAGSPDAEVEFAVQDTGIGINPTKIEQLFEPFEQVNHSYNRSVEGTGLGLSISRDIVRLMGSDIRVKSTLGLGSRFSFSVPLYDNVERVVPTNESEDSDHEPSRLKAWSRKPRILVAEDSQVNKIYLESLLENLGCQVLLVENGQLALDALQSQSFDLLIFDIQMPVMSGYDALAKWRASSEEPVAIALTACQTEQETEMMRQVGFAEVCSKPMRQAKLRHILIKHCQYDPSSGQASKSGLA